MSTSWRRFVSGAACVLALAAFASAVRAATAPAAPTVAILGTWHGTSTCVDREFAPACHDEVVIYEFRPVKGRPGHVWQHADKVVDGQRGTMGELEFTWEARTSSWVAEFRNARVHVQWRLAVRDSDMTGSLIDVPTQKRTRAVSLHRD